MLCLAQPIILVQLKVALKSDFLKCPVSILNDSTSNVDTLDRKSERAEF